MPTAPPVTSTLPEALAWLYERTGVSWSRKRFLETVVHREECLYAVAPLSSHWDETARESMARRWPAQPSMGMTVVYPTLVQCFLHRTLGKPSVSTGGYLTPLPVPMESLRVMQSTLNEMLLLWERAKRGDTTKYDLPRWMHRLDLGQGAVEAPTDLGANVEPADEASASVSPSPFRGMDSPPPSRKPAAPRRRTPSHTRIRSGSGQWQTELDDAMLIPAGGGKPSDGPNQPKTADKAAHPEADPRMTTLDRIRLGVALVGRPRR